MPSNIRFLYNNQWSNAAGTISALSAASGLPAAASQNPDRTYLYRSLSQTADQTLTLDRGASVAATMVALANVRLQNAGSVRLEEAGTGGAPGAWNLVATLPAMDPYTRVTFAFFNSVSARHWRFRWINGNPAVADYAELGYAGLGAFFEPTKGVRVNTPMGRPNVTAGEASVDGQKTFARRTRYMAGTWEFGSVGQADMDTFLAMDDVVGIDVPFFAVLDSSISWQAWLVRQTRGIEHPRGVAARYAVSMPWEEAR